MITKLTLGPGPGWREQKQRDLEKGKESIAIDLIPEFEPDIVADITHGFIDLLDGAQFDEIEAYHIFEHLEMNADFKQVMWDCLNTLNPGGTLDICVPYWKSNSAVECFEHTRFFNENSFMNFYANPYYKEMKLPMFDLILNELRPKDGELEVHVILRKPL